jgi:hypothetical protein
MMAQARASLIVVFLMCALSSLPRPASADERKDSTIARYVFSDGGFALNIDRRTRWATSESYPTSGERTQEGHIITDSMSHEYGDCSTVDLVCADFEQFVLAVPRRASPRLPWAHGEWTFKMAYCLSNDISSSRCSRFIATFQNNAEDREGGFLYSDARGVEMHFDSRASRGEKRSIYILASEYGLLHGGTP